MSRCNSGTRMRTGGAPLIRAICSICSGGMDASMSAMPPIPAESMAGRDTACRAAPASLAGAGTAAAALAGGIAGTVADLLVHAGQALNTLKTSTVGFSTEAMQACPPPQDPVALTCHAPCSTPWQAARCAAAVRVLPCKALQLRPVHHTANPHEAALWRGGGGCGCHALRRGCLLRQRRDLLRRLAAQRRRHRTQSLARHAGRRACRACCRVELLLRSHGHCVFTQETASLRRCHTGRMLGSQSSGLADGDSLLKCRSAQVEAAVMLLLRFDTRSAPGAWTTLPQWTVSEGPGLPAARQSTKHQPDVGRVAHALVMPSPGGDHACRQICRISALKSWLAQQW